MRIRSRQYSAGVFALQGGGTPCEVHGGADLPVPADPPDPCAPRREVEDSASQGGRARLLARLLAHRHQGALGCARYRKARVQVENLDQLSVDEDGNLVLSPEHTPEARQEWPCQVGGFFRILLVLVITHVNQRDHSPRLGLVSLNLRSLMQFTSICSARGLAEAICFLLSCTTPGERVRR